MCDNNPADDPATATNFYGFGLNSYTLRYQTTTTSGSRKSYCGTSLAFTITNTGYVGPSDIRFKSDVQNITNALDILNNLQGKTFYMNGDTSKRQMGFIAQEVIEHVPEVVFVDTCDENNYHFLQYNKLIPISTEGIKELVAKVNTLEQRIQQLENNI